MRPYPPTPEEVGRWAFLWGVIVVGAAVTVGIACIVVLWVHDTARIVSG